jgi:ppGpp synthetase/RelA/SpoT-type nucleotidyltranferase
MTTPTHWVEPAVATDQLLIYPVPDEVSGAFSLLTSYRAQHVGPLGKANMGLRSMVRTEGCRIEISQRLKRIPTILDKLQREPGMNLARMQDIAGCRAVLDSIDEVRRVQRRLARNRPPLRVSDYAKPRTSGYRGVHVVVEYDERAIEVQLRTRVQNEWATTVEQLTSRTEYDLKNGQGPAEVHTLLRAISEAMACEERDETVDEVLTDRLQQAREAALPLLRQGGWR